MSFVLAENQNANISYSNDYKYFTPPPLTPLSPAEEAKKEKYIEEQIGAIQLKQENLSYWQKKLDSDLLSIIEIDSNNKTVRINETDLNKILAGHIVISANQVRERFGINSNATGDVFLVTVVLDNPSSAHNIDPYVVNVSGTIDRYSECWIDVEEIEPLAKLDNVARIRFALPSRTNNNSNNFTDGNTDFENNKRNSMINQNENISQTDQLGTGGYENNSIVTKKITPSSSPSVLGDIILIIVSFFTTFGIIHHRKFRSS